MEYPVIAIPSHRRASVLKERSLKTLLSLGAHPQSIFVFVADEKDYAEYEPICVEAGVNLLQGVPGLLAQRRFYNSCFASGTPILNVDDDLYALKELTPDGKKLQPFSWSIPQLMEYAFGLCDKHGARLWGITAVENAFYMAPEAVLGLKYICGIFHGTFAGDPAVCGADRIVRSSGEDFETTFRAYRSSGKVLRVDWLCPKTKYFAPGGMEAELGGYDSRQLNHTEVLRALAEQYPDCVQNTYEKAGGVINLRLRRYPSIRIPRP